MNRDTISKLTSISIGPNMTDYILQTKSAESLMYDEVFPTNDCNFPVSSLTFWWLADPIALIIGHKDFSLVDLN